MCEGVAFPFLARRVRHAEVVGQAMGTALGSPEPPNTPGAFIPVPLPVGATPSPRALIQAAFLPPNDAPKVCLHPSGDQTRWHPWAISPRARYHSPSNHAHLALSLRGALVSPPGWSGRVVGAEVVKIRAGAVKKERARGGLLYAVSVLLCGGV